MNAALTQNETEELTRQSTTVVEWLAALWQLTSPPNARSANPHLVDLLREVPDVLAHPAAAEVARVREVTGRDAVIKSVVCRIYDRSAPTELDLALDQFVAEMPSLLGSARHDTIAQARIDAQRAAAALAGPLDPAADVAQVTGESVRLRAVLAPSVFLPPPGAGRHSVLVKLPDGSFLAHLHFGFPLRTDPRQFALNRSWLNGGAWHYAVQLVLDRHWPAIAAQLLDRPDLGEALRAVIDAGRANSPFGATDRRPWVDALAAQLNIAIKCSMARRLGFADYVHRDAAVGQGCVLMPWLEAWFLDGLDAHARFSAYLATLPDALAAGRADWERIAAAAAARSTTSLNGVLTSPDLARAVLVLPDDWSPSDADAAAQPWAPLALPIARYRDWLQDPSRRDRPAIAIGDPARHPLVQAILDQRGLTLSGVAAAAPTIVALSPPGFPDALWCVAVAVARPEVAAALRPDTLFKRINTYVIFDAHIVIDTGHDDKPVRTTRQAAHA